MLLRLVSVLCCVLAARACLRCFRKITALQEEIINSARTFKKEDADIIWNDTVRAYDTARMLRGHVIDLSTLHSLRTTYENDLFVFLKNVKPNPTEWEVEDMIAVFNILNKGVQLLNDVDNFKEKLCPNTCGRLIRTVMNCKSCSFKAHDCLSRGGLECGEFQIEAEEGSYAVLNCFLPWHRFLLGNPEYHYSLARSGQEDFKPVVVTEESHLVLNQLHLDEQGTYRCSLENNETVFYQVTYLLTVKPLSVQTRRPKVTLPTLPLPDPDPTDRLLVPLFVTITALSLVVTVGLAFVLVCEATNWWTKPKKRGKQEEQR